MILIVDNHDSFVYNIVHVVAKYDNNINIVRKENIKSELKNSNKYKKIIISPGPGFPRDNKESFIFLRNKAFLKTPILGVCLGMQIIIHAFGGEVIESQNVMHGKISNVFFKKSNLFHDLGSAMKCMRYHSLIANKSKLPDCLKVIACTSRQEIMAIEHVSRPVYGVQFHPESILTIGGERIIENFIKIV